VAAGSGDGYPNAIAGRPTGRLEITATGAGVGMIGARQPLGGRKAE